jgi:hypothetical protein
VDAMNDYFVQYYWGGYTPVYELTLRAYDLADALKAALLTHVLMAAMEPDPDDRDNTLILEVYAMLDDELFYLYDNSEYSFDQYFSYYETIYDEIMAYADGL